MLGYNYGLKVSPVAPRAEVVGGRRVRWAKTRQDDKMYQRHIDFLPMDGQSPQSRQLIEN
jgi:hypothetical protein